MKLNIKKIIILLLITALVIFLGLFFVFERPTRAQIANYAVISEIQIQDDEFVELHNPASETIEIGDWYFCYFSSTRDWNNPWRIQKFPDKAKISPYSFYLIGLKGYALPFADWQPYVLSQLSDTMGSIAIFPWDPRAKSSEEAKLRRIDAVAWGDVSYVKEDSPTLKHNKGESIQRKPGGDQGNKIDTNNNASDFFIQTPTPQNSQSEPKPALPKDSVCGNGNCESGENSDNCPNDCPAQSSPVQPPPQIVCGNGICEAGENLSSCLNDCLSPSDIVINEFVSNPIDSEEEWIELYNKKEEEINLDDWQIEEGSGAITKISGKISPQGFFVIEKIKGYLNNSGDIIILRDKNSRIIDYVTYGDWNDGSKEDNASRTYDPNSAARINDGFDTNQDNLDFKISTIPTKAGPNKFSFEEKKYPFSIIINELLPNPKGDDSENEFIELKNLNDFEVDLEGWKLEDASEIKFIISSKNLSSTIISPKGFLILKRKLTKIPLNNFGSEILKLYQPNDNLVDSVKYSGEVQEDFAYAKNEKGNWAWTTQITPDRKNVIKEPNQAPKAVIFAKNKAFVGEEIIFDASDSYDLDGNSLIYFWDFGDGKKSSEILTKHSFQEAGKHKVKLEVKDIFGDNDVKELKIEILEIEKTILPSDLKAEILISEFLANPLESNEDEWIEIFNDGKEEIDLSGWFLDDQKSQSRSYRIKEGTKILPGKEIVFYRKETKIVLNNNFDSVRILDPNGNLFYEVSYQKPKKGYSFAIDEKGDWYWTSILTPGEKNQFSQKEIKNQNSEQKTEIEKKALLETPLSQARNQNLGDLIKIRGVVSVEPGILGEQIFYLSGSGIQIYFYKKDFPNLKLGDRIEVIGELAEHKGEKRIKIVLKEDIKILNHRVSIQPKETKTGGVDENSEGNLVVVKGQLVESKTNYFYLDDGSGEIKIYFKKTTNLKKPELKQGEWLKIIGIVSQDGQEYRILPRYQSDIEIIKKEKNNNSSITAILSDNLSGTTTPSLKIKLLFLFGIALLSVLVWFLIKKKKT